MKADRSPKFMASMVSSDHPRQSVANQKLAEVQLVFQMSARQNTATPMPGDIVVGCLTFSPSQQ